MTWVNGEWVTQSGDEWAGPQTGSGPVRTPEPPSLLPGETWPQWGARTGRYAPDRIPFWENEMAKERSRVIASGGNPRESEVAARIVSCYPALAPGEPLAEVLYGQQYAAGDPRRVLASAGLDPVTGRPVRAAGTTAYSETPLLDAQERAMYGPSREERHREQDLAAEREYARQLEREQALASSDLSDEEWDRRFREKY